MTDQGEREEMILELRLLEVYQGVEMLMVRWMVAELLKGYQGVEMLMVRWVVGVSCAGQEIEHSAGSFEAVRARFSVVSGRSQGGTFRTIILCESGKG